MKAVAGIVVALVAGCAIGYGIAVKMPKGSLGQFTSGVSSGSNDPIFEYDGKKYSEADLPIDVQSSIYDYKKETVHRIDTLANQYAMRIDLARTLGRDKESPLPAFEDLLQIPKPADEEIQKLFNANKDRLPPGTTFEQIKPDIEKYLTNQKMSEVMQEKATAFKTNNKYNFLLAVPLAPMVVIDTSKFPVTGGKDSKIVVVEVADYLCPHCQVVQTEVEQVITDLGATVKFHAVPFSLRPEGLSGQLARGAHCAYKQGEDKFWAWHKSAFSIAKAKGWKVSDPESKEALGEILAAVQLDVPMFEACVVSEETKTFLTETVKTMNSMGVSATPTFFVNGRRLDFHGGDLKSLLEKHLKASSH